MSVTETIRRPVFYGIAISACVVVTHAVLPEIVGPLIGLIIFVAVVALTLLLPPISGAFAIRAFVRWINRRDDPRNTTSLVSHWKASWNARYRVWCHRLVGFGLGAAIPYMGWSVYRSIAEPPLLSTHSRLMTLLMAGDFDQAYELTTDEYRAHHNSRQFQSQFQQMKGAEYYAPDHPTVLSIGLNSAEVYIFASPGFFEWLNGPSFFYRKERGDWRFTGSEAHYLD